MAVVPALVLVAVLSCLYASTDAQVSQDILALFRFISEHSGDPCLQGTHNCAVDQECISRFSDPLKEWVPGTEDKFRCRDSFICPPGLSVARNDSGSIYCQDLDECLVATHSCFPYRAHCVNTEGSYDCTCNTGYVGDGRLACDNINECETGTHACSELAQCTDTIGSYRCQCAPGFLGDGHMKCMDLDECLYGFHDCGVGSVANCANIPGSFFCRCDTGWSGDAKKCEDVDECASASACPGNNTVCSNTVGSYTCSCADGFSASAVQEVDGTMQCVDHDECLEASLTGCDANADCVNLPGTYHCACRTGYTGDGKACVPENNGCPVSPWSRWSACAFSCVPRPRRRLRTLLAPPPPGVGCPLFEESLCPSLKCDYRYDYETEDYPGTARDKSLVPVYVFTGFSPGDCEVTRWGPWTPCCSDPSRFDSAGASAGMMSSTHRIVVRNPTFWGRPCPPLVMERKCSHVNTCKS